jgi:acetyl esterase/lipase
MPCLFHIHGGGFIGDDETGELEQPLAWASAYGMTLVSGAYRLAPEAHGTELVEDCYAGLVWVRDHPDDLGIDADQIIIERQSAGAGLGACLMLLSRDRQGPNVAAGMLCCPMLDDRLTTVSSNMLHGTGTWDHISNETG